MSKKSTPTFVHEMPLRTDFRLAHALTKRFDVMHFPYNVVLQEMLARLERMRDDPRYQTARQMSGKDRSIAFAALRKEYGFEEYAAHDVVKLHIKASGYLADLVDSHVAQTLASRAFDACEKYAFGVRGRPRFKRKGEIASVEGKGDSSPLNWKDDHAVWGGKRRDRRMVLRPIFNKTDRKGVEAHALSSRVKYVRLLRRKVAGNWRFYVQLVCEGQPKARFEAKDADVGIDLGPSTAAIVSHEKAALVSFLPEIEEDLRAKRRLQRQIDRSRRATNPDCFNADGTWKRGKRQTVFSRRYCALRAQLAEQERVMAETRDRAHGRLSNIVLANFGKRIHTEKLSKRAWQKMWGRRMKATAPGMLMSKTERKAGNAGGSVYQFNAGRYRLSQYDHTTEDFVKKPLSQRIHILRDGSGQVVQRDLYSAWLALFIDHQANTLDAPRAKSAWAVAHPSLARAASSVVKVASWKSQTSTRSPESGRATRTQKQQESAMRPNANDQRSRRAQGECRVTLCESPDF